MTSHQQSVISYSHSWPQILQHDRLYIYTGCDLVQKPTLLAAFPMLQEHCTSAERQAQGAVYQRICEYHNTVDAMLRLVHAFSCTNRGHSLYIPS